MSSLFDYTYTWVAAGTLPPDQWVLFPSGPPAGPPPPQNCGMFAPSPQSGAYLPFGHLPSRVGPSSLALSVDPLVPRPPTARENRPLGSPFKSHSTLRIDTESPTSDTSDDTDDMCFSDDNRESPVSPIKQHHKDAYAEATKHLYDIFCIYKKTPRLGPNEDSTLRNSALRDASERIDEINARIIAQDGRHSDHKIRTRTFIRNYWLFFQDFLDEGDVSMDYHVEKLGRICEMRRYPPQWGTLPPTMD
ncbi:hypothetical protein N7451_010935 [Penicillium sp. IBT 35674x]|nr:hypothetical protein N7451_010935 [Penicillium sp. IBT 35674x]